MTDAMPDFSSAPPLPFPIQSREVSQGGNRVVLLDANNLAARSFHAAKGRLTTRDEQRGETVETGSLHLFCISLSKFLRDLKPTHFVACWDGGRSVYREQLYPEYKLARHAGHEGEPSHGPAFSLIWEFLTLTGIEQWFQAGVEADDLIAAGHRVTRANDPEALITIMSSDKDLLQLLDDRSMQLRFSSHGTPTDVWDRAKVIKELGYTPEQIPLVMAFTGDTGDGIPGIKGIGPVKAKKLLAASNWDWQTLMTNHPDIDAELDLMRALVDLLGDLCCEVGPVPAYDPLYVGSRNARARLERVTEFCARYQLRELWNGIVEGTLWW